jgi:hypothetical protein
MQAAVKLFTSRSSDSIPWLQAEDILNDLVGPESGLE